MCNSLEFAKRKQGCRLAVLLSYLINQSVDVGITFAEIYGRMVECWLQTHHKVILIIWRFHMHQKSTNVAWSWGPTKRRADQTAQATGLALWRCREGLQRQVPWLWGLLPRQLNYHVATMHCHRQSFDCNKPYGTQGSWSRLLQLAFQSVGIIYGDVGTSPLYAISSTFPDGIKNRDDLLGVLSLILYTLILIPMVKYVFIVLYADDHGDGKLIHHEFLSVNLM